MIHINFCRETCGDPICQPVFWCRQCADGSSYPEPSSQQPSYGSASPSTSYSSFTPIPSSPNNAGNSYNSQSGFVGSSQAVPATYGSSQPAAPVPAPDSYGAPQAAPVPAPDSYGAPQAAPVPAPDSYGAPQAAPVPAPDSYGAPQAAPVPAPDSYGAPQAAPVPAPDSYGSPQPAPIVPRVQVAVPNSLSDLGPISNGPIDVAPVQIAYGAAPQPAPTSTSSDAFGSPQASSDSYSESNIAGGDVSPLQSQEDSLGQYDISGGYLAPEPSPQISSPEQDISTSPVISAIQPVQPSISPDIPSVIIDAKTPDIVAPAVNPYSIHAYSNSASSPSLISENR